MDLKCNVVTPLYNMAPAPLCSFVRSVTMDKWKDIELEKMKAGGNGKYRLFLELQDDYDANWSLQEKYNSKAAALFRDKVAHLLALLEKSNFHIHYYPIILALHIFTWSHLRILYHLIHQTKCTTCYINRLLH